MTVDETERLAALRDLALLDTPPEERFDRLTSLAATMLNAPIALVSLIDEDRQWFKSRVGLAAAETPRTWAFCNHAIQGGRDATLVVEDATLDLRFADDPLVTGEPHIRFYAGAALTTTAGHNIGTLCIIDTAPRAPISGRELGFLKALAQIAVDEIECRRAMQAVAEHARLLDLAESMSGVGSWRMNAADERVSWSDEVYRIHGLDRARFRPNLQQALDFYDSEDRSAITGLLARALERGEGYEFRAKLRRDDGSLRHVSSKAECELDAQGRVRAVFGVFQDVTEQVNALAAMAEKTRRAEVAERIAGLGHWRVEFPQQTLTWSDRMYEIYGLAPGDPIDVNVGMEMVHPDDRALTQDRLDRDLAGEFASERPVIRIVRPNGEIRWVIGYTAVERDAAGQPTALVGTLIDVTRQTLLDADLVAARAEAETAAAVKSVFMANMSHELRTPLTSILGFSSLLTAEQGLTPEGRRAVDRVRAAGQALLTIVNDILEFSKLEAGQVEIEPRAVALGQALEESLLMLEPQAQAKGLHLEFCCRDDLPDYVLLDDNRVRQVLLNLIGNAVKFTGAGGVRLSASYDLSAGQLRCEIADSGPGVAPDRLDRLFKRFSQVDASTTRAFGGTGLGLAICKGLIEAMGGAIGVSSVLGEGSVFWFELPCPKVEDPALGSDIPPPAVTPLRGVRLLLADDHAINRELVRLILSPLGVAVTDTSSGEEAIELAALAPFDLILMDIRMDGAGGAAAARAIRAGRGPNDQTPIIAFSALDEVAPELADAQGLFNGRLAKPISPQALIEAVSRWGASAPLVSSVVEEPSGWDETRAAQPRHLRR